MEGGNSTRFMITQLGIVGLVTSHRPSGLNVTERQTPSWGRLFTARPVRASHSVATSVPPSRGSLTTIAVQWASGLMATSRMSP